MSPFEIPSLANKPNQEKEHPLVKGWRFHGNNLENQPETRTAIENATESDQDMETVESPKIKASLNSEISAVRKHGNKIKMASFTGTRYKQGFGANPVLSESLASHAQFKKSLESQQAIEQEKGHLTELFQSRDLARISSFILDQKTEHPTFEKEIQRVQNKYEKELESAKFLNTTDWRILTALEMFSEETFLHSIQTYGFAKEIFDAHLTSLDKDIEAELGLEQFYRACLFHDVGKFLIPKFIIDSKIKDEVWVYLFSELSENEKVAIFSRNSLPIPESKILNNYVELQEYFKANEIRPASIVPASLAFNEAGQLEILENEKDKPLLEIMKPHEKGSSDFLKICHYDIEARLAGHHHNYEKTSGSEYTYSRSALQSVAQINETNTMSADAIHTIDIIKAMTGHRQYSQDYTPLQAFVSVIHQAESNDIERPQVAARIINVALKLMQQDFSGQENEVSIIKYFLATNLPEDEKSFFE